jgi:hypothetical protein
VPSADDRSHPPCRERTYGRGAPRESPRCRRAAARRAAGSAHARAGSRDPARPRSSAPQGHLADCLETARSPATSTSLLQTICTRGTWRRSPRPPARRSSCGSTRRSAGRTVAPCQAFGLRKPPSRRRRPFARRRSVESESPPCPRPLPQPLVAGAIRSRTRAAAGLLRPNNSQPPDARKSLSSMARASLGHRRRRSSPR